MRRIIDSIDSGNLKYNTRFRDLLLQNRLNSFDSFMACPNLEIVKEACKERSTAKLVLRDGRTQFTFYLKRHTPVPFKEYLKLLTRFSWPRSALNEWRAILRFHEAGIPTMVPVAAGEKRNRLGLVRRSFVMTQEIAHATRLDHHLAECFRHPLLAEHIRKKRKLIDRLAHLTRKMHDAGLNHRDYYLCHIFVRDDPRGENVELFVMDLHRVDIRRKVAIRWIIKDLAALNYSSSALPIHTTDRIRFFKRYVDKERLERTDLRLLSQIAKKTKKIARHAGKRLGTTCHQSLAGVRADP